MSTNLTVVSNQLPAYLQQSGMGYEDSGVGSGIAPRPPRLGITTDKQFTITKDGNKMIIPRDPDGQARVRCVLIAGAESITKAWYSKGYVPGSVEAPDCFSNDSKTPAPGVKAPQCANCASCPKNAFGSHPVTGRGKACGDRKMVVLVWEGLPDELITFNAPTMTLQNLQKIDAELRNANIPMQAVMMELTFDPAIMYPVVKLGAIGYVAQETAVKLIARSKSADISDLLRETDFDTLDSQNDHKPESLIPSATYDLGGGATGTAGTAGEAQGGQGQAGVAGEAEPAKRRRRTKAEMEAARAAGGGAAQQETVADLVNQQSQQAQDREPTELERLQAQLAALQAAQAAPKEKTPEELQVEALQAQLAALQSGQAQRATQVQQEQPATTVQTQQTQTLAGTAPSVADLLAKWKTGN